MSNDLMSDSYRCKVCDAHGVKLWRLYQTFLNHQKLYCAKCACADQKQTGQVDESGQIDTEYGKIDQIGSLVPAVPTPDGSFWGYTSVPEDGVEWWRALPTVLRAPCELCGTETDRTLHLELSDGQQRECPCCETCAGGDGDSERLALAGARLMIKHGALAYPDPTQLIDYDDSRYFEAALATAASPWLKAYRKRTPPQRSYEDSVLAYFLERFFVDKGYSVD